MGGPRVPGRLVGLGIAGISYIGLTLLGRPAPCLMPKMFMRLKKGKRPDDDDDDC